MRAHAVLALAGAAVAATLPGCVLKRSRDASVFVLEPLAARGAEAVPAADPPAADSLAAPGRVVGVLPVTVPGWIDRPQITARAEGSRIAPDELARWGEPVARGVQRVIAENLAALLPGYRVLSAPWPNTETVGPRVEITLTELARQADGSVALEARWAVIGADRRAIGQRRSAHRQMAAPGAGGTVEAASALLAVLSREIAEALSHVPPSDLEPTPAR
jgi:uncharacterized lipoprotein YmbA